MQVEQESPWKQSASGKIYTTTPGKIYHKLALPEQCEIEIQLESSLQPSFRIGFDRRPSENLRVETWEDVVVLVSRYDFAEVMTLKPGEKQVHLHLYLDRQKSLVYAYSHDGQKLAEFTFKQPLGQPHGIFLENLQHDLTLKHVCVSQWDGSFPQPVKTGEQRLLMADGGVQYGSIGGLNTKEGILTLSSENNIIDVPLESVSQLVLGESATQPAESNVPQISWTDGTFLTGQVEKVDEGTLSLKTSYSPKPLVCKLNGADNLVLPDSKSQSDLPDRVYFPGGSLAGNLTFESDSETPIYWKPIGGLNSTPLSASGDARFLRGSKDYSHPFDSKEYPDAIFLQNDDIIPAHISSGSAESLEFSSPFCSAHTMPSAQVRAIEFTGSQIAASTGFSDSGWKMVEGKLNEETQSVSFESTGSLGNNSILKGDEVRFHMSWGMQPTTVVLNFFSDHITKAPNEGLQVHLTVGGTRMTIETAEEVERRLRNRMGMRYGTETALAVCNDRQADFRCVFQDGEAIFYINGQPLKTVALARDTRQGMAFTLHAQLSKTSVRATVRTSNGIVAKTPTTSDEPFVISQFSVESIRGSVIKQFILEESRRKTLLVPRFNRTDPPTHVMIAPNGDLLRGRLEEVTNESISFESRLEPLRFDKLRASALIWLPKPLAAVTKEEKASKQEEKASADSKKVANTVAMTPAPSGSLPFGEAVPFGTSGNEGRSGPMEDELQLRLTHGFAISMKPSGVEKGFLIGTSELLGDCRIPISLISGVYMGRSARLAGESAYAEWVPIRAPEPEWDIPEDSEDVPGKQLVGRVMDDFELASVEGGPFKLSDHADKVIVLDFWATWCGPCVRALPGYIDIVSTYDKDKVIFVAMNLRETPQQIREFLSAQNYSVTPKVALDTSGEIADRFRVTGIPHTVVLSPGLVLQTVHVGFSPDNAAKLSQEIDDILAGKLPSEAKAEETKTEETN